MARASNPDRDVPQMERSGDGANDIQEGSHPLGEDTPRLSIESSVSGLDGAEESHEVLDDGLELAESSTNDRERTGSGLHMPPRSTSTRATNAGESSRIESMTESQLGVGSSTVDNGIATGSTKSLLDHKDPAPAEDVAEDELPRSESEGVLSRIVKPSESHSGPIIEDVPVEGDTGRRRSHIVSFAVPEDSRRAELLYKARATQANLQRSASGLIHGRQKEGRIMKMEKMLVRVDKSANKQLPDDYDENGSQGVISRTSEKWREFMVVCRENLDDEADFLLQMYKTRVC